MPPESDLVARVADLERALAARDRTIEVLMDRVEERLAAPSSAFAVLQQSIALEHAVTSKTRELAEQKQRLADALRELQMTQAELTQSQKLSAIGQLAAGVAHEINTPIQYVGDNLTFLERVFAQLLPLLDAAIHASRDTPDGITRLRECLAGTRLTKVASQVPRALEQSLEGVARVSSIVNAMKAFSHPSGGAKALFDLREAIESTVTVARNEWKYVADVELEISPGLPLIYGMRDELNQVILNLVVNAAHAIADEIRDRIDARGRITIVATQDEGWCEIRVCDTGAGIPEAARPKIFDPFFTTKPVGKGTGQGLAIAHNVVVEKHGGTIAFETKLGVGTSFIIRIPAQVESAVA
jgi:signal transduction histidine kinase